MKDRWTVEDKLTKTRWCDYSTQGTIIEERCTQQRYINNVTRHGRRRIIPLEDYQTGRKLASVQLLKRETY
jgi:hypothetical protein